MMIANGPQTPLQDMTHIGDSALDGERIVTSHQEIAEQMQQHSSKVGLGKQEHQYKAIENSHALPALLPEGAMRDVAWCSSANDIQWLLRRAKAGKAPGPDGFPADLLKAAPAQMAEAPSPLFPKSPWRLVRL
eukprot:8934771-Pyramimonas_sp.AAC.2